MLAKKRGGTYSVISLPKKKTPKQMERHLKGVANYRRIEILFLIGKESGITLDGICESVGGNIKTISEHTKKLAQSGLVDKLRKGRGVGHSLSPYGRRFLKFIKTF